jgi:hypothetical protein
MFVTLLKHYIASMLFDITLAPVVDAEKLHLLAESEWV